MAVVEGRRRSLDQDLAALGDALRGAPKYGARARMLDAWAGFMDGRASAHDPHGLLLQQAWHDKCDRQITVAQSRLEQRHQRRLSRPRAGLTQLMGRLAVPMGPHKRHRLERDLDGLTTECQHLDQRRTTHNDLIIVLGQQRKATYQLWYQRGAAKAHRHALANPAPAHPRAHRPQELELA